MTTDQTMTGQQTTADLWSVKAAFRAPQERDFHPVALAYVIHRVVERHAERDRAECRAFPPRRDECDRRNHIETMEGDKGAIHPSPSLMDPDIEKMIHINQHTADQDWQAIAGRYCRDQWQRHREMLRGIGHKHQR